MSLFSRIDRIRGGRGNDDREDDSVFGIPDIAKKGGAATPSAAPADSKANQPAAVPVTLPPRDAAPSAPNASPASAAPSPTQTSDAAQTEVPKAEEGAVPLPPRLSPLERLARRTAELEEEGDAAPPEAIASERPAMSRLAERLGAEVEADTTSTPTDGDAATQDDLPVPHAPFRRPSLLSQLSKAEKEGPPPDDASAPSARDLVTTPETGASESAATFEAVVLPPRESEAVGEIPAPVAEATAPPASPASPVTPAPASGGTAFDRLMAARAAGAGDAPGTGRQGGSSLAERLAAMRSNAEANAQARAQMPDVPVAEEQPPTPEPEATDESAPVVAEVEVTPESHPELEPEQTPFDAIHAAPANEVTYDPEASLEDVLPPEEEAPVSSDEDEEESTPEAEVVFEPESAEESAPEAEIEPDGEAPAEPVAEEAAPEPVTAQESEVVSEPVAEAEPEIVQAEDEPTALPVSTLGEATPNELEETVVEYVEPDVEAAAPQESEDEPVVSVASAPPPFVEVEVPPAPVEMSTPAPEEAPVAPPLPWEVESVPEPEPVFQAAPVAIPEPEAVAPEPTKPEAPALTGWRARLMGQPQQQAQTPQPQAQAPAPTPAPIIPPSVPMPPSDSTRPEPQVPTVPAGGSLWAQRLAGRNAIRDTPIAPANVPEPVPAPVAESASESALERAAGQLARTGGEGLSSEAEARNRALYRQKHFIFDAVLGALDARALQNPTRDSVKTPIERAVDMAIREFNLSLDSADRNWMVEEFVREVTDMGPLVGLLDDVTINKVLVVGSTDVAVERLGRIERTGISFRDDDHLMAIVRRIADTTGGRIDAKVPLLDRPLPDGARIRAKIPPLAPQPTLTIEKSTGNPFTALKRQQAERGRENALPYAQLRERIQQRLLREFESNSAALSNPERLRTQVEEMIGLVIAEEKVAVSRADRALLVTELLNEIVGLGPIEPLLNDPEVDEVMVNGPYQIYVERKGKLEISSQRFRDNNHVMQVIERIVAPLGRRVDEKSPMVDGRLRDGSRFNAIIPPLSLGGPTMTIRKFARDPFTMTDLINFGSLSREAAQFLQAAVEGRLNIIVSGGTGSGKTTTLNVLSSFIPASDRIVTIEDAAELQLRQEHVVRLETRPPNIEGAGEIGIRDLVRNSLRMRPDRIVVGECRGGEALDMLQAMNTGHDGSLTTAHSNGPRDTVKRLETMVMMAGFDLPIRAIREQISMAVHLIVHQERMRDGKRRVTAVTELVGMEGDVVTMQDIFRFEQERIDDEGRIIGSLAATGLRPQNFDNIIDHGVNLSMDLFQPRNIGGRDADLRSRLSDHRIGAR